MCARWLLVLCALAGCDRVFGLSDISGLPDAGEPRDPPIWVKSFTAVHFPQPPTTFTSSALTAGDAVVFVVTCHFADVTDLDLTAPGWTFSRLSGLVGQQGNYMASFGAIA